MIVVPYTKLWEETVCAVPEARFERMEGPDSYREFMAALWREGEAFTLVEHDCAPTRDQLDRLETCAEPWCYHGYFPGHWVPVFGCVRFSEQLIAGTSGAFEDRNWLWDQLDARFAVYARERGFRGHWHYPHVRHAGTQHNEAAGSSRHEIDDKLRLHLLQRELASLQAVR